MIDESTLMDIKPDLENNNNKTTKEILSNLLKKMLDHKLSKLEKKHIEESNTLKGMSKISQNIILSLDYYSHKVRKELYKIRHKNDESTNKKISKENNNNNKSLLKEEKNNLESLDNIFENNINNISSINKTKRASKSIEAKKAKELILTPEINNKEKKIKKEKTDVFSRLASKSIGNFKKNKLTMTESSKSKNKKLNLNLTRRKSNNNLINKKNEIINSKEDKDTPSRPEKKMDKEKILKLTSTPKSKQKIKSFTQTNLENSTNTLCATNNTSRLKKVNSKGKIKKSKKEEKKNNMEENDVNDLSVVKKINEINIDNVILTDNKIKENNNFEENKKESINEKIFIDDEILKNVNKDELLISSINTNINNVDTTIKDFSLKESINTIYENNNNNNNNNNLQKKISTEMATSVNSFNQSNKNMNNIKLISKSEQIQNKEKEKEKENENNNIININDLDNIILPKKINNFLENEKEINFSLINYSNDNINGHELDKTIDLNISGLSEHLSLEEKFEGHLDEITRYLDIPELCKLMLVNKECYTTIMNILVSKTEITIDILEEEISKLKESNTNINFDEVKINPFSFSSNSTRAISLLNNSSGFNLTNSNNKTSKEIFIIFGIFFIAVGKKKEYLSLVTEEQKINYISNYFKKDVSLGNLIENEIKGKVFDDKTIASLYKYSYRYINIISPNRFQRINKDFAIFVFVVKNILEHIGALEQNIKPEKEFVLYNARLKNNKEILEILNDYFDKIG